MQRESEFLRKKVSAMQKPVSSEMSKNNRICQYQQSTGGGEMFNRKWMTTFTQLELTQKSV